MKNQLELNGDSTLISHLPRDTGELLTKDAANPLYRLGKPLWPDDEKSLEESQNALFAMEQRLTNAIATHRKEAESLYKFGAFGWHVSILEPRTKARVNLSGHQHKPSRSNLLKYLAENA